MQTSLSTSELEQLFDRTVIVTPLEGAPQPDAVVFWNANNEGFVIQSLHTARDRALLARRMEGVRQGMTEKGDA